MGRSGRHRKQGYRKPSGDIIRSGEKESPKVIALRQPHRRLVEPDAILSQDAATPLGVLFIIGAVSTDEYRSAERFARIVARYRMAIESPRCSIASISGAFEPKRGMPYFEDHEERRDEYDDAFEALSEAGNQSARIVALMAVQGEPCPQNGYHALIRGLRRLSEHFGLTKTANYGSGGK